MMKRGQVTIFIIVAIFFVAALVLVGWLNANRGVDVDEIECSSSEDCIPDECCDAEICVPLRDAPDCGEYTPTIVSDDVICAPGCDSKGDRKLGCDDPSVPGDERPVCVCIEGKCQSE